MQLCLVFLWALLTVPARSQINVNPKQLKSIQQEARSFALKISEEREAHIEESPEGGADQDVAELIPILKKHGVGTTNDVGHKLNALQVMRSMGSPDSVAFYGIVLSWNSRPPHEISMDDLVHKTVLDGLLGRTRLMILEPERALVADTWEFTASLSGKLTKVHRTVIRTTISNKMSIMLDQDVPPNTLAEKLWRQSLKAVLQEYRAKA